MDSLQLNQRMQDTSFPMIEAVYCESSNAKGDTVSAYAVTDVNVLSEGERLDFLTELASVSLPEPKIIYGCAYASSDKWTVPDGIIDAQKKYGADQIFKVIWLEDTCIESEYHGYAGYEIRRLRGIVLRYPEELACVA